MELINIADLKNPETGKTYREENNAKQHKYKVNDLVEIIGWGEKGECGYDGMRMYVIGCVRDCDGTPLYVLGTKGLGLWETSYNGQPIKTQTFYNFKSHSGFGEVSLRLIKSANS